MTQKQTEQELATRAIIRLEENKKSFIERANTKHNNFYNYDKVEYVTARKKVIITCPIHGDFVQYPYSHLIGGCNKCAQVHNHKKQTFTTDEFINRAQRVHGNLYDYSKVEYKTARIKVSIVCPKHGEWMTIPDSHLRGNGCNKCGNENIGNKLRQSLSEFIKRSRKVHGEKYDYSFVEYINAQTPVNIICPEHGVFEKRPDCHVNGQKSGCARCSTRWQAESDWLDAMNVPNDAKHRQVTLKLMDGSKIRVDGKVGDTIYEFWGTYYHGHPDFYSPEDTTYYNQKFADLFRLTQEKIEKIKASGYSLQQMWEHDWLPQRFTSRNV